jgi:hypothetical protein
MIYRTPRHSHRAAAPWRRVADRTRRRSDDVATPAAVSRTGTDITPARPGAGVAYVTHHRVYRVAPMLYPNASGAACSDCAPPRATFAPATFRDRDDGACRGTKRAWRSESGA